MLIRLPASVILIGVVLLAVTACSSSSTPSVVTDTSPLPTPNCSAPPPVRDIWALAPMLRKEGVIHDAMSRDEQEHAIRAYIAKRNEQFLKCNK